MKQYRISIAVLWAFFLFINVNGQDEQETRDIYLSVSTWKISDGSRIINAVVTTDGEEDEIPVLNLPLDIYFQSSEDEELLGQMVTDAKGKAIFTLPADIDIYKDENAYMNFTIRFEGNDDYFFAEEYISVIDAEIDFEFEESDGERQIYFYGTADSSGNVTVPLMDNDLYFYVPRMFSLLPIGDGWLEEDGTGYIDFPEDIIGDSLGNITVIARIEDHFDYGFIEKRKSVNWAIPKHQVHRELPVTGELWTPIAPLWMIITLIIMLVGVWGHYIYAVYELYKIKKAGKKQE